MDRHSFLQKQAHPFAIAHSDRTSYAVWSHSCVVYFLLLCGIGDLLKLSILITTRRRFDLERIHVHHRLRGMMVRPKCVDRDYNERADLTCCVWLICVRADRHQFTRDRGTFCCTCPTL